MTAAAAKLRWMVVYHLFRAQALERAGRYQDAAEEELIAEVYDERLWMLTDPMELASMYARSPLDPSTLARPTERSYLTVEEGIARFGLQRRYPVPVAPARVFQSPPPLGMKERLR